MTCRILSVKQCLPFFCLLVCFASNLSAIPDVAIKSLFPEDHLKQIPIHQATPILWKGKTTNEGDFYIPAYRVKLRIVKDGQLVYTDSVTYDSVQVLTEREFSFGPFLAAESGMYEVEGLVYISTGPFDGDPGNDTLRYSYFVSDSVIARDDGVILDDFSIGAGPEANGIIGQNFKLNCPALFSSISFYLNAPVPGDTIYASVYDFDSLPGNLLADTREYVIQTADANGAWITLSVLNGPFLLDSGTYYFGVNENHHSLSLAYSSNVFVPAVTWFFWNTNPFGPWSSNEDFGLNTVYLLRPNLLPYCPQLLLLDSLQVSEVQCPGDQNGSIEAFVSGGVSPLSFLWSTGDTVTSVSGLEAGSYWLSIQDSAGCKVSAFSILGDPVPVESGLLVMDESFSGAEDGMISCSPTGGIPPYTYSWSNQATDSVLFNLSPGSYSVLITDANGCSISDSAIVAGGPVSIESEFSRLTHFSIFPNPANKNFNFEIELKEAEEIKVTLLDPLGKKLYEEGFGGAKSIRSFLDVRNFPSGIYLFKLSGETASISKKVVIN